MFLLFIEQEIVYKDKEAGRRWKKHYVGVTNPNRREQTTEKCNEEPGGDRITKQLHRPDEQQTPSRAFHGVREKTGGSESEWFGVYIFAITYFLSLIRQPL